MLCDYGAEQLQDEVHHFISVLTGARKRTRCPECGSEELYEHLEFIETHELWDDDYEIEQHKDFQCAYIQCNDCDYRN